MTGEPEPKPADEADPKYELIDGMVLKYRSDAEGWLTATIWIDDEPKRDIGRAHIDFLGVAGGAQHMLFVTTMSGLFDAFVLKKTGEPIRTTTFRKPKRGHESEPSSAQGGAG